MICVERNFKQHYFTNQKLHYSVFLWEKNGIDCAARQHDCHQPPLNGILSSAILFFSFLPWIPSRVFVHIRSSGGNEQVGLDNIISEQTLQAC